jgi:putative transcriptional regulator
VGERGWRAGVVVALAAALLGGVAAADARGRPEAPPLRPEPRRPLTGRPALRRGALLVASRMLVDPRFAETVVLLLAYDQTGAMGVIVNRPSAARIAVVVPNVEELRDRPDVLYLGGPLAPERLLLLVRAPLPPAESLRVLDGLYVSGNLDELRRRAHDEPRRAGFRVYAGYAGWGAGQLDVEVLQGEWYVTAGDADTVLGATAPELWPHLIERVEGVWAGAPGTARIAGGAPGR